jgi:hypothetical protein
MMNHRRGFSLAKLLGISMVSLLLFAELLFAQFFLVLFSLMNQIHGHGKYCEY